MTEENDYSYKKDFFKRFSESQGLRQLKEWFNKLWHNPHWFLLGAEEKASFDKRLLKNVSCDIVKKRGRMRSQCFRLLFKNIKYSTKKRTLVQFKCLDQYYGLCIPLIQGNTIYGCILICPLRKTVPQSQLDIISYFLDGAIREVQKDMELTKLYETIRPKAIALSTIHTIHRLLTSTLDKDELLPRIARLCIQVLRSKQCNIVLFDPEEKKIKTKITADINQVKKKIWRFDLSIVKRVMKTGLTIRKRNIISTPLFDEDVVGIITVKNKLNNKPFSELDEEILTTLSEQAVIAIKNAQLYEEQEKMTLASVKSLATILNARASYLCSHPVAFVELSIEVAKKLGLSKDQIKNIHYAYLLHDAGKINIPEKILNKPAKLTGKEYRVVKKHPIRSAEIIEQWRSLAPINPIILHHHERFDGKGYPKGLKGEQIPIGSRIMAVVDAFEAMISKRPYRKSMHIQESIEEIRKKSGTQFDPVVVDVFLKAFKNKKISHLFKDYGAK